MTSESSALTAATGASERVCLSVVPVKVLAKGGNSIPVETYTLLDSGSEITLCHEREIGCKRRQVGLHFVRDNRLNKGRESTSRPDCGVSVRLSDSGAREDQVNYLELYSQEGRP